MEILQNGDYIYKDGDVYLVIRDFDVQHPELRIYGQRGYTSSENRLLSDRSTYENRNIINYKNNFFHTPTNIGNTNRLNINTNNRDNNDVLYTNYIAHLKVNYYLRNLMKLQILFYFL